MTKHAKPDRGHDDHAAQIPFYKTLSPERREVLFALMREWTNESFVFFAEGRSGWSNGTIPVGAAGFDEGTLRGAIREEFVSALSAEPTLDAVEERVTERLRVWVANHNKMRSKDISWVRDLDTGCRSLDFALIMRALRRI